MHHLRSLSVTFGLCRPDRSASSTFLLPLSLRLFPVSVTLCVSGVCLYSFVYSLFIGFGPITGIISCSGKVPIGASIDIAILFLSVFRFGHGWYSGSSLRYLENVFFVWFGSDLDR